MADDAAAPAGQGSGEGHGQGSGPGHGSGQGPAARTAFGFTPHALRPAVLGEMHARPAHPVEAPRTVLHLAFLTGPEEAAADRAAVDALALSLGEAGPGAAMRQCRLATSGGFLRWESHTEFSTYTFDAPGSGGPLPPHPFGHAFRQPGPLIAAVRLDLLPMPAALEDGLEGFDPISLCVSRVADGETVAATDFRQDADGFTRIRVFVGSLSASRTGYLVQRLIEIETYRTLALLGLPEAQRVTPSVRRIEAGLVTALEAMKSTRGLTDNQRLLDDLTDLAADLEAGAAASAYRFAATRAYREIVAERLEAIREQHVSGYGGWRGFLQRRFAPAMRTCIAIEARQIDLSTKLARAANLLRTRVDVELERQNRDLLHSMNLRGRLQLRLQQTVEGLSVAAISYYVVSLIAKVAEGLHAEGLPVAPELTTALSVPAVVLAIWWVVRSIRRHHADVHFSDR
ncbi:DUF3422 domain-containing protein [Pseudoxanthobacter sp.]|uniref:DUF3422 family protein n=1 Tax=Pseudoxanthobacter sp. TaxID=1925742 RepID=UPI002FE12709